MRGVSGHLTNALVRRMSRAANVSRKAVSSAAMVIHKAELGEGHKRGLMGKLLWRCGWHGGQTIVQNMHLHVVEETISLEHCSMIDCIEVRFHCLRLAETPSRQHMDSLRYLRTSSIIFKSNTTIFSAVYVAISVISSNLFSYLHSCVLKLRAGCTYIGALHQFTGRR